MPAAARSRSARWQPLRRQFPSAEPSSNPHLQQKSLARIARLMATLLLAKSVSFDWLGYVPDFRLLLYPEDHPADGSNGFAACRSQWRDRGRFSRPSVFPCQLNCRTRVYAALRTVSIGVSL